MIFRSLFPYATFSTILPINPLRNTVSLYPQPSQTEIEMTRIKLKIVPALALAFVASSSILMAQVAPPTASVAPVNQVPTVMAGENYFEAGNACSGEVACSPCRDEGLFGKGWIKRSDHAFDDFISPMTNPVFFEDPRNVTEARAIFFNHKLPLAAGSGNVQLYAVQLRARLSENVSLIATKDGYIDSSNPLIPGGWADLSAGLKFNLIRDECNQRLVSGGFTFEMPTGEADALQGNGNGELNLFLTAARRLGCRTHWISAGGFRLPMNNTDESTSCYWSNHLDYQIRKRLYLLTELNWYHWLSAGQDGPLFGVEGLDAFNLGSPGVAGNDIVTGAAGAKFKPNGHHEIGCAFEFPLTEREDVLDNRLTVDWIIRY